MTAIECAIDGRPTEDGWICGGCTARTGRQLAEIITLLPDARLVAAGQVRNGTGGAGGKPGSRPPLNVDALDALDGVQNRLTTTARDIAETRGMAIGGDGPRSRLSSSVAAERPKLVPTSTPEPSGAS